MQFLTGKKFHFLLTLTNKYFLGLFLVLAFAKTGISQHLNFDSIPIIEIFKQEVALFEVDRFNQVYVINAQQDLIKYDTKGKEQFRYSNYNNGLISKVDVSNPMQILVYYGDFLLVKILDRTLSEIGSIALQDQEIYNPVSLCRSNNNGLWIFDPLSQLLQRIDLLDKKPVVSQNLAMQFNKSIFPLQLIEHQNRLLMVVPEEGIFVFDVFGQFIETLNISNTSSIFPFGKKVFYMEEGLLFSFDLETGKVSKVMAIDQEKEIIGFKISSAYFYFVSDKKLQRVALNK